MTHTAYFADTNQAISWFMEQNRMVGRIKTSNIAYENEIKHELDADKNISMNKILKWAGVLQHPSSKEETVLVKNKILESFNKLDKRSKAILLLLNLGDFSTPELYEKAKKSQKILKQQGCRVILQYKYSQVKVADLLKIDKTTVYRNLNKAKKQLEKDLNECGFIVK